MVVGQISSCGKDFSGAVAFGKIGARLVEEVGVEARKGVAHPRGVDFEELGDRVGAVCHVLNQPSVDRADVPIARNGVAAGFDVVEIPLRQLVQGDEVVRHFGNGFAVEDVGVAEDAPDRLPAEAGDDIRTAQFPRAADVFNQATDVEEMVPLIHRTPPRR